MYQTKLYRNSCLVKVTEIVVLFNGEDKVVGSNYDGEYCIVNS